MNFIVTGRTTDKVHNGTVRWTTTLDPLAKGGDGFRGRPLLTARIHAAFQALYGAGSKSTADRARANLHYFWRFLDDHEALSRMLPGVDEAVMDDLTWDELEAIWRLFIDWLRQKPDDRFNARTKYYINATVCTAFAKAFEMDVECGRSDKQSLDIYVYFSDRQSTSYGDDVLEFDEAKAAFRALARTWGKY